MDMTKRCANRLIAATVKTAMLALLMAFSLNVCAKENPAPAFKDYPASAVYSGKPAKVVLDTPMAKMFRTRLGNAATRPADFAGEYVLALFGCGTDCVYGAAVSLKTGRVTPLPGSVGGWYGEDEEADKLEYRLDSHLLIARGRVDEAGGYGSFYYFFNGQEFKLVRFIPADYKAHQRRFGERIREGLEDAEKVTEELRKKELSICKEGAICGWVGMNMLDVTPEAIKTYGLKAGSKGAMVVYVLEENPAQLAGIRATDLLISINGNPVKDSPSVEKLILAMKPGEVAKFSILRRNKPLTIPVTIARRPPWPCINSTGPTGPPRCGK